MNYMNAFHPEWKEGFAVPDSALVSDDTAWYYIRIQMFKVGMKFQVENSKSYWFIHTQEADRGEHGIRELTEFCYVSLFGDTFTGHATEYFDPRQVGKVMLALVIRERLGWTTRLSQGDNTVEAAIADQHEYADA
ncbi:hypothetical protein [Pseudomonas phage D6]|nr:hypothetical protein [Pseudomonas phage D6]